MLPTREKVLSFEFTPSNEELGKMYAWLLLERTTIACADSSLATCDVDAMTLSLTRRMSVKFTKAGDLAGFLQRFLKKLKEVLTQRTMLMLGLINRLTILNISLTTSKRMVEFLRMRAAR